MIQVVVLLKIKDAQLFAEFESKAIGILRNHGGELASAFTPNRELSSGNEFDEVHNLNFPDLDSFKAYRSDPELQKLSELRNAAITNTAILVSDKSRSY
ncbi:MAG: DUF1330 domain-containing protein [Pseudomonadales bacterium]|nr:DUF1330 domain-containing protein [Pseudomonadales bacterium]